MSLPVRARTCRRVRSIDALLCCWLLVAAACAPTIAAAQELTILRYELLAELVIDEPAAPASGGNTTVSFTAFGTRFALALTPNEALTGSLSPELRQRVAGAKCYTGTLNGDEDSWVRLTRTATELSGAIWDGAELYVVEPYERVAAHAARGPDVAPTAPIIYRWTDTLSALTDAVAVPAASSGAGAQKPKSAPALFDELATLQGALAPARMLDIAFVADSEFMQAQGSRAEPIMLGIANTIDGIFADQLGVRVRVAELRTFGAEPDAFDGTDSSLLLRQLESFKLESPEMRSKGLVHLLTGRDLDERPNTPAGSRLLGFARLGSVCDERLGASLSQYYPQGAPAIVVAHEIAHNLGAPHDGESGSVCESAPDGFIMTPFFNGGRQFSQCSVEQMASRLAAAGCLVPDPSFTLLKGVASVDVVPPGGYLEIDWTVLNQGQMPATGVRAQFHLHLLDGVEILASNGGACGVPDPFYEDDWECAVGGLAAGATVSFKLRLRAHDWIVPSPGSAMDSSASLRVVAAEPVFNYRNGWSVDHITVTRDASDAEPAPPASAEVASTPIAPPPAPPATAAPVVETPAAAAAPSGGGGGALDPWMLWALLGLAAWRGYSAFNVTTGSMVDARRAGR